MLVSSAVIYGLEIVAHTKGGKAGGVRAEDANFIGSWTGLLQWKDSGHIGQRTLKMELPGRRKQGRGQRWFREAVKVDMQAVGVIAEIRWDGDSWSAKGSSHSLLCVDSKISTTVFSLQLKEKVWLKDEVYI